MMNDTRLHDEQTGKPLAARTTGEVLAAMREEDEAAERQAVLQSMTPACQEKLRYFDTWLRNEVSHTLRSRYELGLQVRELYDDEWQNGGRLYGRNAIGRICKLLRWDDGVIRLALRFAQAFTPEDLERLCALALPRGETLTWSHVRALLAVDDPAQRLGLLERTAAEGWTCTELAQEVKGLVERPAQDRRGRPPRAPKDFDGAVAQQQQSAEQWDRHFTRVWGKQDRSLVTQAARLPAEHVTEERLCQARDLAAQLRRVADQAREQAEQAEQVVREFERVLGERGQVDGPAGPAATAQRRASGGPLPRDGEAQGQRPRGDSTRAVSRRCAAPIVFNENNLRHAGARADG
jgi:hypothetical protein